MISTLVRLNDSTFAGWAEEQGAHALLCCVGAQWCENSASVEPLLRELGDRYSDQVRPALIDWDESPELRKRFHVDGIPTLLLVRDGRLRGLLEIACQPGLDECVVLDEQAAGVAADPRWSSLEAFVQESLHAS
jgi:thiol-disulfide isomerase/thioredoxin